MADKEQRSGPFDELRFEQFERLQVEVVGRLVEDEEVGRAGEEAGEEESVAFATRQSLDR